MHSQLFLTLQFPGTSGGKCANLEQCSTEPGEAPLSGGGYHHHDPTASGMGRFDLSAQFSVSMIPVMFVYRSSSINRLGLI